MRKFVYETCCVHSTAELIEAMTEKAQAIEISTFRRKTDWREWARALGYVDTRRNGLTLDQDWHVRFFKSKYAGRPCYYAVHSEIEYIFTMPN